MAGQSPGTAARIRSTLTGHLLAQRVLEQEQRILHGLPLPGRNPLHHAARMRVELGIDGREAALPFRRERERDLARVAGVGMFGEETIGHEDVDGAARPALVEPDGAGELSERERAGAPELSDDPALRE